MDGWMDGIDSWDVTTSLFFSFSGRGGVSSNKGGGAC